MLTSDLDVLVLTLTLILRPSQQYSAQPAVAQALKISTYRLQCLTRWWNNIREAGVTLVDLVTEKGCPKIDTLPPDARDVHFTFYRKGTMEEKPQEKPTEPAADITPNTTHATPAFCRGPSQQISVGVLYPCSMPSSRNPTLSADAMSCPSPEVCVFPLRPVYDASDVASHDRCSLV